MWQTCSFFVCFFLYWCMLNVYLQYFRLVMQSFTMSQEKHPQCPEAVNLGFYPGLPCKISQWQHDILSICGYTIDMWICSHMLSIIRFTLSFTWTADTTVYLYGINTHNLWSSQTSTCMYSWNQHPCSVQLNAWGMPQRQAVPWPAVGHEVCVEVIAAESAADLSSLAVCEPDVVPAAGATWPHCWSLSSHLNDLRSTDLEGQVGELDS